MSTPLIGLFVGGKARRMGGIPKGLLSAPGESRSVAARLRDLCLATIPGCELVLVGDSAAYGELALNAIADDPSGVGPLGGLHALLKYGEAKSSSSVFSLACDLPYVTPDLLTRLLTESPEAISLAPHYQGRWQPFFARFRPHAVRPHVSELLARDDWALQALFRQLGAKAHELTLNADEQQKLGDWDTPDDVHR